MTPHDARPTASPSDLTLPGSSTVPSRLELDQGTILLVDRVYVLGRDPEAPASHPDAHPFRVPDQARSITKTHLAVGPTPDGRPGVAVTDLFSTNGVVVNPPGQPRRRLVAGTPETVPPGTLVEYGDRTMVVRP